MASITTPAQIEREKILRERMVNFVESKANKSISFNLKNDPMKNYWEICNYRTDTYSGEKIEIKSLGFDPKNNSADNIRFKAIGFDFRNVTFSVEFLNIDSSQLFDWEHVKSIHVFGEDEFLIETPTKMKMMNFDGTLKNKNKPMNTILISIKIGL